MDSKNSVAHNYAQDHFWPLALAPARCHQRAESGDLEARDNQEEESSTESQRTVG